MRVRSNTCMYGLWDLTPPWNIFEGWHSQATHVRTFVSPFALPREGCIRWRQREQVRQVRRTRRPAPHSLGNQGRPASWSRYACCLPCRSSLRSPSTGQSLWGCRYVWTKNAQNNQPSNCFSDENLTSDKLWNELNNLLHSKESLVVTVVTINNAMNREAVLDDKFNDYIVSLVTSFKYFSINFTKQSQNTSPRN